MIKEKHFKQLLIAAIIINLLSMWAGYSFGWQDAMNYPFGLFEVIDADDKKLIGVRGYIQGNRFVQHVLGVDVAADSVVLQNINEENGYIDISSYLLVPPDSIYKSYLLELSPE